MAEPKCPTSTAQSYASITNTQPWEPGVLTRTPWSGLAALLGAVVCACLTVAVLAVSDGQPVVDWSIRPPVYLAILSALTNALLRFAFSKGVTIAWWTESLHGGTVESLHRNWGYGDSIWAVISPTRHFHSLRVAAFIVAFVAIDGPLLQRASSVSTAQHHSTVSLTLPIRPGPVFNTTLVLGRLGPEDVIRSRNDYTAEFSDIAQAYTNRKELILHPNRCRGTCETTVAAAGFSAACTANRTAIADVPGSGAIDDEFGIYTIQREVFFAVSVENAPDYTIAVRAFFRDKTNEKTVAMHYCKFFPAIVYYDIRVTNGTISLLSSPTSKRILELVHLTGTSFGLLLNGGFALALEDQYNGSAVVTDRSGVAILRTIFMYGPVARRYMSKFSSGSEVDTYSFADPMPDIFATLDELSLRYAMTDIPMMDPDSWGAVQILEEGNVNRWLEAHPGETPATLLRPNQTVQARQTELVPVYTSNYPYLAAALAVMLLTTTSIIPTFYGWWHLGRPMTLSPIEIAKAFDAKLLKDAGSNATAEEIVTLLGSRRVQYGVSKGQELVDMPPKVGITMPNIKPVVNEGAEEYDGMVSLSETEDNAFIEGDRTSIEGDSTSVERDSAQVKHWSVCRNNASLECVEMQGGAVSQLMMMDAADVTEPRKGEMYG
ncbi:hypothetical protein W97_01729 [Coniosporium apollinis CBS 100218]|uniref:Uncharacterized protein n=1 Tax=Coniosporium apollinis (strain CBS 100218) TaxID=1168221 RepID=R7YLK4_CONA1|nr:uncharacterized protein W97_01729 [Coniosporium apollinis CBS 100218]EON62506.1 hypothetical protein W97_01729 [Coniosporium apollinis CBS 100218]